MVRALVVGITGQDRWRKLPEGQTRSDKLLHADFIRFAWLCLAEAVPSFAGAGDVDARPGVLVRLD